MEDEKKILVVWLSEREKPFVEVLVEYLSEEVSCFHIEGRGMEKFYENPFEENESFSVIILTTMDMLHHGKVLMKLYSDAKIIIVSSLVSQDIFKDENGITFIKKSSRDVFRHILKEVQTSNN
jgi:hypothetical protein